MILFDYFDNSKTYADGITSVFEWVIFELNLVFKEEFFVLLTDILSLSIGDLNTSGLPSESIKISLLTDILELILEYEIFDFLASSMSFNSELFSFILYSYLMLFYLRSSCT